MMLLPRTATGKPPCRTLLLAACMVAACSGAWAGSKQLTAAFLDLTAGTQGKRAFKALRASQLEHSCWHDGFFSEIDGVQTVYLENPPGALHVEDFRKAVHGDARAAEQVRSAIHAAGLNGAWLFMPDVSGRYGVIYGMGGQSIAISSSASVALPGTGRMDARTFSRRLCEASKAMD